MRQSRTISLPAREISLFAKQRISLTYKAEKRESYGSVSVFLSLLFFIAGFAFVLQMHRSLPIPLFYFSDKDLTLSAESFFNFSEVPQEAARVRC